MNPGPIRRIIMRREDPLPEAEVVSPPVGSSLDSLFEEACKYGRFRVSQMKDGGWHATIDLFTTGHAIAEVKSNYNHLTPHSAMRTVIDLAKEGCTATPKL